MLLHEHLPKSAEMQIPKNAHALDKSQRSGNDNLCRSRSHHTSSHVWHEHAIRYMYVFERNGRLCEQIQMTVKRLAFVLNLENTLRGGT